MTDDERAFIRAAAADPDDDTIRLVYADWLDEQGAEVYASHAAFARLQVRRSRTDPLDPGRADLVAQEAACLRKHTRAWNGRVHRYLARSGLTDRVDARRGSIRGWNYHRGMIASVTVTNEALTTRADLVFALGPITHLRLATWPVTGWSREAVETLGTFLPRIKVVALAGMRTNLPLPNLTSLRPLATVPLFDLRAVGIGVRPAELFALARAGTVSPVVLYRGPVMVTRTRWLRQPVQIPDLSRIEVHVIDPHGKWDALRLGFADLTGEVLTPVPYQAAS
ncbi:TIGR02996 domain-containing protein [Frigoriglobus tundricola]|uniref:TIGR02996 domain-containing protein n=1 Tax=Frigoriglobus tundricola TaxID=2774151 RepID=A0A6M5Z588_9BACT|nr:TIGR02996 domain-containing protein [Frigoriglobus tundricola]QJX00413.1 hypothetical protein FTUN_8043 [Frigoriglobus tundricola]